MCNNDATFLTYESVVVCEVVSDRIDWPVVLAACGFGTHPNGLEQAPCELLQDNYEWRILTPNDNRNIIVPRPPEEGPGTVDQRANFIISIANELSIPQFQHRLVITVNNVIFNVDSRVLSHCLTY